MCFQCYRADLERDRALKAAGELNTATEARFQCTLPFDPINRPRLERLKAERAEEQRAARTGIGDFTTKRHRAQIAARHALQEVTARVRSAPHQVSSQVLTSAIHAAELQLPESWLSFVVSG